MSNIDILRKGLMLKSSIVNLWHLLTINPNNPLTPFLDLILHCSEQNHIAKKENWQRDAKWQLQKGMWKISPVIKKIPFTSLNLVKELNIAVIDQLCDHRNICSVNWTFSLENNWRAKRWEDIGDYGSLQYNTF